MARNQRVLGHAPMVIEHREIAVAKAAVQHFQNQLIGGRLEHRTFSQMQWSTRLIGLPDSDRHSREPSMSPRSSQASGKVSVHRSVVVF